MLQRALVSVGLLSCNHFQQLLLVLWIVHPIDYLLKEPVFYVPLLYLFNEVLHVCLLFCWVLLPHNHPDEISQRILNMKLDLPELLITFVLEYFDKQLYFVVFILVDFHAVQKVDSGLHYQVFEAILLVEIREHELFHRLSWQS